MKPRIRIHALLIMSAVCFMVAFPKIFFPIEAIEAKDEYLDILGIFLILIGYVLRIASRGYKRERSGGGNQLVKDGPYAFVRNPMYLGTLFIGSGIILTLFQFWLYLLFLIVFMSVFYREMTKEKTVLVDKFGKEYADYCQKVPPLFPSGKSLMRLKDYIFLKHQWVVRELPSFFPVILMVLGIEAWQDYHQFTREVLVKELLELVSIVIAFAVLVFYFYRK